jgi:hypothetical protein
MQLIELAVILIARLFYVNIRSISFTINISLSTCVMFCFVLCCVVLRINGVCEKWLPSRARFCIYSCI